MTNTNVKLRTNKFTVIILITLLALVVASVMVMTSVMMFAQASENGVSASLERYPTSELGLARHTPTLNDDFAGDRVIVTLRQGFSDGAVQISSQSFKTTNVMTAQCVALTNFSSQSIDFSDSIVIDSIRDMMPLF